MSAFTVNDYHIDRLVATAFRGPSDNHADERWYSRYLMENGFDHQSGPDAVGQMLIDANVHSVNHRYHEATTPSTYTFEPLTQPMTAVEALKALSCYEYQSCEDTATWPTSSAHDWCEQFRSALIRTLPGYDAAPWEQVPARVTA